MCYDFGRTVDVLQTKGQFNWPGVIITINNKSLEAETLTWHFFLLYIILNSKA